MATTRHHLNARDALRRVPTLLVMVLTGLSIASLHAAGTGPGWPRYEPDDDTGRDTGAATFRAQDPLAIEGAFERESYAPGSTATLRFFTTLNATHVRIFHVGPELMPTIGDREMRGIAVTGSHGLARISKGGSISIRVGDWESGLYFAELTGPHGRIGYSPFIVRPHRLGEHRIAVVLPTRTWQAYNFRDDDGDGRGDTWYANWNVHRAALARPFLDRGVPPHFRRYDLPFLHWLAETGKRVDVLSQADLEHADGRTLARAYQLIVFPGHHEYVTKAEYDAVRGYRNLGGNLAFLSANNFFWRIEVENRVMYKIAQWRDLGRPEAALLGVEYRANDRGGHRGPWLVRRAPAAKWLFDGVELRHGDEFGNAGIEIDATAPSSPRATQVVAEIPSLMGPGLTAQMTYYETPAGAKVFAAGAFTLAGSLERPEVRQLVENVWRHLTTPTDTSEDGPAS